MDFQRKFERRGPLWVPRYERYERIPDHPSPSPTPAYDRFDRYKRRFRRSVAAINFVGGGKNGGISGTATSQAITYSPTAGNTICFFLSTTGSGVSSITVKDQNSNALTAGPTANKTNGTTITYIYSFYGIAVTGATSYTASWTTGTSPSTVLEEYSGVGSVNASLSGNTAIGTTSPATITVTTDTNNAWVAAGISAPAGSITLTSGNSRQSETTGYALTLADNTVVTAGSINIAATVTGGAIAWAIALLELKPLVFVSDDDIWRNPIAPQTPESVTTVWQ